MKKPVIGLVGGIGGGKSAVAREFTRHGGRVLDADSFGHEALRQPAIIEQVRERWADAVVNDAVDRKKLGAIVFANESARLELQRIVFPWIDARIREEIARAQEDRSAAFLVLDAAIMLETGWQKVCDRVLFVDTPRETRIERLKRRNGWTEAEIAQREAAQWPVEQKAAGADATIVNAGGLDELRGRVDRLVAEWGLHNLAEPRGWTRIDAP